MGMYGDLDTLDRRDLYQKFIELMCVILVIAILAMVSIKILNESKKQAWITQVVGQYVNHRETPMIYFAHHGQWPESRDELKQFESDLGWVGHFEPSDTGKKLISQMDIENGAIHYRLNDGFIGKNKLMSFRPAVNTLDSSGPVIWVVEKEPDSEKWLVSGEDRTNIAPSVVGRHLQSGF